MDEICPNTFEEMRQNDGIGSDNMTIIIVDFLQNSGGCNGKVIAKSNSTNKKEGQSGYGQYVGAQRKK